MYQVYSGFLGKGISENSRREGNLRVGEFKAATTTHHKYLYSSADEFIARWIRLYREGYSWLAREHLSSLISRERWTALELDN